MASAKFRGNRFKIDGEIAENHAIPVNVTASIRVGVLLLVGEVQTPKTFYIQFSESEM